jgi:serine/threonine protein kinase
MDTTCIHLQSDRDHDRLTIFTACPTSPQGFKTAIDEAESWHSAFEARTLMEKAVRDALAQNGSYPRKEGYAMLSALGWENGLQIAVPSNSEVTSQIKLNLDYKSCWLVPELVPVEQADGQITWLDRIAPIYRTLEHVPQPSVNRPAGNKVAILYQDIPLSCEIAKELQHELQERLGNRILVDAYAGSQLAGNENRRFSILQDIFTRHICVVFVGHMGVICKQGDKHGWTMTEDAKDVLTMEKLKHHLKDRNAIPELVFGCCCHSASSDPDQGNQEGLSYPKLFLDAGVRFYIGTWTDIQVGDQSITGEFLVDFISAFFELWADNDKRDDAVEHLYKAKKSCGFPLAASLFQIYTAGGEQAVSGSREPQGALVLGPAVGDRIGEYELIQQVWGDRYARTFWASTSDGSFHLVQVLADEFQNDSRVCEKLDTAINKLREAQLSKGHLLPTKRARLTLVRDNMKQCDLDVLIYNMEDLDKPQDWCTLQTRSFDRADPSYFAKVLQLGERISNLLAELHRNGIVHGNLDPGNVVLNKDTVLIKDAWVRYIQPGRCTQKKYAAPEEPKGGPLSDQPKYDCWGLGVILFELATGQPPFDQHDAAGSGLPRSVRQFVDQVDAAPIDALDCVIRECLVPSAELRPSAEAVAIRLGLAQFTDGTYLSEFEEHLNHCIQAGQRLFGIVGDDYDQLLKALRSMTRRQHLALMPHGASHVESFTYRLYIVQENKGLIDDRRPDHPIVPWVGAQQLHSSRVDYAQRNNLSAPVFPTPPEVAGYNASLILPELANLPVSGWQIPIVLLCGNRWWDYDLEARRYLSMYQSGDGSRPAVVVTDSMISLSEDLSRRFMILSFPPISPPALFQNILSFPRMENLKIPEVLVETAVILARGFFPCYWRQAQDTLRMCALRYGVIDERGLMIRDEQKEQEFASRIGTTYIPASRLPAPEHFGLPSGLSREIRAWADTVTAALFAPRSFSVPRRIMVTAPSGCGKTTLALIMASLTSRGVIRIAPSQCIRAELGGSEYGLRTALNAANDLHAAVVLLDDVDHFFADAKKTPQEQINSFEGTLKRMSGVVLNWLDNLPPHIAVVMTAEKFGELPDQWRRRCELVFKLPEPTGEDQHHLQYRSAVFEAIFRKFGLGVIASDAQLMAALSGQTEPNVGLRNMMSPVARRCHNSSLGGHTTLLRTGADIQNWIQETILLFGGANSPETPSFWYDALKEAEQAKER